jgi:hypothetical protein
VNNAAGRHLPASGQEQKRESMNWYGLLLLMRAE